MPLSSAGKILKRELRKREEKATSWLWAGEIANLFCKLPLIKTTQLLTVSKSEVTEVIF